MCICLLKVNMARYNNAICKAGGLRVGAGFGQFIDVGELAGGVKGLTEV